MIFTSVDTMPVELKSVFAHIYDQVGTKFPKAAYKSIGAFSFLRMYCAAITAPHVYGISMQPPKETTQRYLILISKIMTSVANGTLPGQKEPYMAEMTDFIIENQNRLKEYYDNVLLSKGIGTPSLDFKVPVDDKESALCVIHNYLVTYQDKVKAYMSPYTYGKLGELIEKMGVTSETKK